MNKSILRANVMAGGSYFFDRSSMRFFGDTIANYYVPVASVKVDTLTRQGVECWELQRRRPVMHDCCDSAYFDVKTFERVLPRINS